MDQYIISAVSTARDLAPVMYCLHELVGRLPVTARSREHPGIRIEEGKIVDEAYSGPVLEDVLAGNVIQKVTPSAGPYRGTPVVVAPVRNESGEAIAAIGIVDVTGIFDIAGLMEQYTTIKKQVCGTDPCPLPTESTAAKR
nr:DUF2111 domain-containing protein [Methanoculleus sp. FWC-SCC1]